MGAALAMRLITEARELATKRVRSSRSGWAAERIAPTDQAFEWTIALHPPTEREMRADEHAAESWARSWRGLADAPPNSGIRIEWGSRTWKSIGKQHVPVRAVFSSPDGVAAFAGGAAKREWGVLRDRADAVAERFVRAPELAAVVRSRAAMILALAEGDFGTLLDVVEWLATNDVARLRPRQLPIRGIDTKWFGAHRGLVTEFLAALTSREPGIVDSDALIRVRVLDPTLAPGEILDFAAPASELDARAYRPRVTFVFENVESVLAMPPWPGAIAIHGAGYAVNLLEQIAWVRESRVIYWGDLDSHGFAILHRLRTHLPDVTSTLMDEATLLAHRDLWVKESRPHRGLFASLTAGEQLALDLLRSEDDTRLEQERIPWSAALFALSQASASASASRLNQ